MINYFSKSKNFYIKVEGNSMLPFLCDGDIIYLKETSFLKIKTNDLILVRNNNNFLAHRVIYIKDNNLVTKGDNNPRSDGKIYQEQIIGR